MYLLLTLDDFNIRKMVSLYENLIQVFQNLKLEMIEKIISDKIILWWCVLILSTGAPSRIFRQGKLTSPPQVKYNENFKSIFPLEYTKSQQCYEGLNILKCITK